MEKLNASQIMQLGYSASIRELNEQARTKTPVERAKLEKRADDLAQQVEHLSTLGEVPTHARKFLDGLDRAQRNQLFYEYELPVLDQAMQSIAEKIELVADDEAEMRKQMSGISAGVSQPVEYTRSQDAQMEHLVSQLPTMTPMQRSAVLERLGPMRQDLLTGRPELVRQLRDSLPPEVFAQTAAQLMVRWSSDVDQPVTARHDAEAQIARMLGNPEVTERLLNKGIQVILIPEKTSLTELHEFQDLSGKQISQAHGTWNTSRGAGGTIHIAVGAENLTGGNTAIGQAPHFEDGYSVLTHEFAHTIHEHGLTDDDRDAITQAFQEKWDKAYDDEHVQWPDGPTYGTNPTQPNYSATNEKEYFAQLTNAYLNTNTGHDPYTNEPRNNGKTHIHQHEPVEIANIIQALYGRNPTPITANPVQQFKAENDLWRGYRDFQTRHADRTPTSSTASSTAHSTTNSPKLHPTANKSISNVAQMRSSNYNPVISDHARNNQTQSDLTTPRALATTPNARTSAL